MNMAKELKQTQPRHLSSMKKQVMLESEQHYTTQVSFINMVKGLIWTCQRHMITIAGHLI